MSAAGASLRHVERIDRVLTYLAAHLDEGLELDRLAEVACLSRFHFHRVYRAITGETAAATVRRLRLHRAATQLLRGEAPLGEIARAAGYGGAEAFIRAFSQAYGVAPHRYRGQKAMAAVRDAPLPTEDSTMYQVTIDTLPALDVAGIEHRGSYEQIGVVFERLSAWAAGRNAINQNTRFFGVYWDDPGAVPAEQLRSHACLTLPSGVALETPLIALRLSAGRHASIVHKGPYAELEKAYRWLYGHWLTSSGEEPADSPCVEEYLNDCRALPPAEWLTRISMPLKERAGG